MEYVGLGVGFIIVIFTAKWVSVSWNGTSVIYIMVNHTLAQRIWKMNQIVRPFVCPSVDTTPLPLSGMQLFSDRGQTW